MEERDDSTEPTPWLKFFQETTMHGCHFLGCSDSPKIRRFLWFCIIVGIFGALIQTMATLIENINSFSVKSVYKIQYKTALEFPSLSICSLCPINIRENYLNEEMNNILLLSSSWEVLAKGINNTKYTLSINQATKYFNQFENRGTVPVEKLFMEVRWNKRIINASSVFKMAVLEDAFCYLFNGEEYRSTNPAWMVENEGLDSGLDMIIDTHQSYCPAGPFIEAGLKIFIHTPLERAMIGNPDLLISPGTETNVAITKRQIKFLSEPYKSFGDLYCTTKQNYSQSDCINVCVNERVRELCPCSVEWGEDGEFTEKNKTCEFNENNAFMCRTEKLKILINAAEKGEICDCPYPCVMTKYSAALSFSYFPIDAVSAKLESLGVIPNESYARANILRLKINYKRMLEEIIEYQPEYSREELIGSIGGHCGLFLGISAITVAEFIEFIIYTLTAMAKRLAKRIMRYFNLSETKVEKLK